MKFQKMKVGIEMMQNYPKPLSEREHLDTP